jgi:hypothetical protein
MNNQVTADHTRRTAARLTPLLSIVALTVISACGGGSDASPKPATNDATTQVSQGTDATPGTDASPAPASNSPSANGDAIQLTVDPCSLLTVAEIEAALGQTVEPGGFGDELPGFCTHSIGGDVGAGVVQVSIEDPLSCNALLRGLSADSSSDSPDVARVDVGDGGIFITNSMVRFTIGGGCVDVNGSKAGINLGQAVLVGLATLAASRVV